MRPSPALQALILGALCMSTPAYTAPTSALSVDPGDDAAIRAVMTRQADAWNRHDLDAYVAETTPDVEWVNVVGMHWVGRETVKRAHAVLHRTMFAHSRLTPPKSVEMRQVAPGVVITVTTGGIEGVGRTPDGGAYPEDGNIMTEVFLKTPQGWRIAHAHNTNIVARAVAHDPANAPAP